MRQVLLMSNEPATISAVAAALETSGQFHSREVCRNLAELLARLERGGIPAVLVDVDEQPQQTLAAVEALTKRFADTRFAVLSASLNPNLLLLAMRSGVNNFVEKRTIADDLVGVVMRLCPPAELAHKGAMVTVLSAGGGCGATTLAVNLADELARLPEGPAAAPPSLVVDLDCSYGAVGSYLSLDGEYGLLDLLERTDPIDAQLIRSTAISSSPQLHALLGAVRQRLGHTAGLDKQRIGEAMEACKSAYRWTVVDAPRLPEPIAAELVRHSAVTFLMMQLTIKDLRVSRQMLAELARHAPGATVQLLVGRYAGRWQFVDLDEARDALGLAATEPIACLSNDYHTIGKAVNFGRLLADAAKRSELRRQIQKLAADVFQTCQAQSNSARPTAEVALV